MMRYLLKIPWIALCNIVAGKKVVEELLQEKANPIAIKNELLRLINDSQYRNHIKTQLKTVRHNLGTQNSADATAQISLEMLNASTIQKNPK